MTIPIITSSKEIALIEYPTHSKYYKAPLYVKSPLDRLPKRKAKRVKITFV